MKEPGLFDPPESTAPKHLIRDPAKAAAIAKCIIATLEPASRLTAQTHPWPCRYCEFPFKRKLEALLEFNQWAGWKALDKPPDVNDPDWPVLEPQVEAFMRLPWEEQQRHAALAAGYDPVAYGKNTGYEYPVPQVSTSIPQGSESTTQGSEGTTHDESFIEHKKVSGSGAASAQSGEVGGRDESRHRRGRGLGGPEEVAGVEGGGLPDRAPQAPGPDEGDLPVSSDPRRYFDDDGKPYPF